LQANALLMESLTGHPLTAGNHATLLVDGPATFSAMSAAITGAKDHINLETFIFGDDEIGRPFADLLLQKRSEGVQVNLIYDGAGSMATPSAFFERLREGGINVVEFNPLNPLRANRELLSTRRDHRKVMIIDGKVAFTGGVNISGVYSSNAPKSVHSEEGDALGWRDTHVMIEGPAVAQFQELFLKTWHDQRGPDLGDRNYFPAMERMGNELITVIGSTPGDMNRLTYIMYVSAVQHSRRSVQLTNAYFVPDRQMIHALIDAAKRGVDVVLVLPGVSDSNLALYAGRSHYGDLLEAGIKLYERRDRMSHAKTAVIDGVWSTIGSTNLDLWSFMRNDEINAIILGVDFANQMEQLIEKDIAESRRITRERWSRRPIMMRLKEIFARLISHWL
jgi:cardiolipin synthase